VWALATGLLIFVLTCIATTQYIAWRFHFAAHLGSPMARTALPFGANVYSPAAGPMWLDTIDTNCAARLLPGRAPCNRETVAFVERSNGIFFGGTLIALLTGFALVAVGKARDNADDAGSARRPLVSTSSSQFRLDVGTATGRLAQLGHGAAVAKGTPLELVGDDASQNVMIFGGTGAGKTSREINRLLQQAFQQRAGILTFNVKGDFEPVFAAIARSVARSYTSIGIGGRRLNLIDGLNPELASSFLKSAIILAVPSLSAEAKFWINTATELSRNALGVLEFLPGRYSLQGVYRYVYDAAAKEEWVAELNGQLVELLQQGRTEDARRLKSYLRYETDVFARFDQKVQSGALAVLAEVLSPFALPDFVDTFCSATDDDANLERLLDGEAFIVNLPLSTYGLGARTAYILLKLRMFNIMQRRRLESQWNQDRRVVFLCDEYQEIIAASKDGLSDLTFWDKARSSGCVGIVSMQGITSCYAAISDRDVANAVLQNFRQKICFRTEDLATIKFFTELLGQVEIVRESSSNQRSRSARGGLFSAATIGTSQSQSEAPTQRSTINPQLFRQLGPNEALAVLSIGGAAYDDVVTMPALYVREAA
jgi:type IV secretory pathway TraG/TraD family ATPase VirD4